MRERERERATYRRTERERERERERQTDRQTDRQTETDRQREPQTERERERGKEKREKKEKTEEEKEKRKNGLAEIRRSCPQVENLDAVTLALPSSCILYSIARPPPPPPRTRLPSLYIYGERGGGGGERREKKTWRLTSAETIRLMRDGKEGGGGVWRWGKRKITYISIATLSPHQNDMGSELENFILQGL